MSSAIFPSLQTKSIKSGGLFKNKYIHCQDKFVINNFIIPDEQMPEKPFDENSKTNIIKLSIPNTVKSIKDYAFDGYRNLKVLSYYASTGVPAYCFNNCHSLEDVTINNKECEVIEMGAFRKCSKLRCVYLSNIKIIDRGAFEYTSELKHISLPNTLITICDNAFKDSGIEFIKIPDTVENLGENIFKNCNQLNKILLSDYLRIKYTKNHIFDFVRLGLRPSEWRVDYSEKRKEFYLCRRGHEEGNGIEYSI